MTDWQTMAPHGLILGLCIWILKHVRSINITMKNGKKD